MTEKFLEELNVLKRDVDIMSRTAMEMLEGGVKSMKDQDLQLAEQVISRRKEIAEMDQAVEEKALRIMSLYQPMGKDVRLIACTLKMNTYLARVGRYGNDIAKMTVENAEQPHVCKMVSLPYMAKIVCSMIEDATKGFETGGLPELDSFREREDEVDALRYSIFRECLNYMMEDPRKITRCISYIMTARYLERCGDYACKVAEKVHYVATGEHVEIK